MLKATAYVDLRKALQAAREDTHDEARLRMQQPSLRLLGTSGMNCRAEFAVRGVDDFLPKPWELDDLIRLADWSESA